MSDWIGWVLLALGIFAAFWVVRELRNAPTDPPYADVFREDFTRHADQACSLTAPATLWPDGLPDFGPGKPLTDREEAAWARLEAQLMRRQP